MQYVYQSCATTVGTIKNWQIGGCRKATDGLGRHKARRVSTNTIALTEERKQNKMVTERKRIEECFSLPKPISCTNLDLGY